ncbi:MAG: sensor histidine kinase [Treponema sp.]|nr:sensor histidine kinase [Treponema sp.]
MKNQSAKSSRPKSIKKTLRFSYILILLMMILPAAYSIYITLHHTNQYNQIIQNVSRANRINLIINQDISNEIWEIVAGKKTFEGGRQYAILLQIENGISEILETTSLNDNRQKLEVANRAEKTLKKYIDLLGRQIANNNPVSEQEETLEEIRGCASLMNDIFQDFIVAEIQTLSETNDSIRHSSILLSIVQIAIVIFVICLAFFSMYTVSKSIRQPIHSMEILSTKIASGDLSARIERSNVEELDNLSVNLNTMAGKIKELIEENIREQKNLQKEEMKTLQAQITPHFLYNTFDTIIWLAESGQTSQVVEITKAFSNFFRISLSRGHDWIPIEQELEHVKSYLTVQKIRYRDILNYSIDFDKRLSGTMVLKLILQPLVENAIYHGIKNKRGRGMLKVSAQIDGNSDGEYSIVFSVEDNGKGFTPERLEEVKKELKSDNPPENLQNTYGLYNVNKRLNLYYDKAVNLEIQSVLDKGTVISFKVPWSK